MKILVINDDGIESAGLWAAVRAARRVGEVFVVAPSQQQSGVGASLTLHSPVKVTPWTPADEFVESGPDRHPVTAFSAEGNSGRLLHPGAGDADDGRRPRDIRHQLRVQPGLGCDGVGDRGRRGTGIQPESLDHRRLRRVGYRSPLRCGWQDSGGIDTPSRPTGRCPPCSST